MVDTKMSKWLCLVLILLNILTTKGAFVSITKLESAVAKGAVCLDGSPPAYYFQKGSGEGTNNWLVFLTGGGWCNSTTACLGWIKTLMHNTNNMTNRYGFNGTLSNQQELNPYFYNWNIIKVVYCDGSSFTGDVENVDPANNLHFRGQRIWNAVMEDLLAKGMKDAKNAILTGSSAGGVATILHCDSFHSLFPKSTKVKCISDAGFFINAKDIRGEPTIENMFSQVAELHGSAKNLPASCTSERKPGLCFFPEYVIPHVQTPIFIVNSPYDLWQLINILVPKNTDPNGTWISCKSSILNCTRDMLENMQKYRSEFLNALSAVKSSKSNGMFIDSCYTHNQIEKQEAWFSKDSTLVGNKKMADAVGEWFNADGDVQLQEPDCQYPCNPTCHHDTVPAFLLKL